MLNHVSVEAFDVLDAQFCFEFESEEQHVDPV